MVLAMIALTLQATAAQKKEAPNTRPIQAVLNWVMGLVGHPPTPDAQKKELPHR